MASKIYSQLSIDDPIKIDSSYRSNDADRRSLDDQIQGIERHIYESLISGAICTWAKLSAGSPQVFVGSCVCLTGEETPDGVPIVTLAIGASITNAGTVYGVVIQPAPSGSRIRVAISGYLPKEVTGLTIADNAFAVLDSSSGSIHTTALLTSETYYLGTVLDGNLNLGGSPVGGIGGAGGNGGDGKNTIAAVDNSTGVTLNQSQASKNSIRITGSISDHRPVTLPTPSSAALSYMRTIFNGTSGGYDIIVQTSAVSTSQKVRIAPGTNSIVEIDENGVREIEGGIYDPRDFGARCDGVTDDLPALQAMISAMSAVAAPRPIVKFPRGICWISDRWIVNRGCEIRFSGNQSESGLEVAQGRTGIVLEASGTPFANNVTLRKPFIRGYHLVHPTANGNTPDGCNVIVDGRTVRKGEVFVKLGGTDPTFGFRATTMSAGGGRGPSTCPVGLGSNLTATVGSTYTDANGTTWVCEKLINTSYRQNSHAYSVGDRVLADRSHVYCFRCTASTGNSAASPPSRMAGYRSQGTNIIGDTFTDGNVTWTAELAAGIYVHATYAHIEQPVITGFQGPAMYAVGGVGYDTQLGDGFCDGWSMNGPAQFNYCGMGLFQGGDDDNGWWIDGGVWGQLLGRSLPTPTAGADAYTNYTNPGEVSGGHLLHDCSQAGGFMGGLYAQTSTGYPVLHNGTGALTLMSCYSENGFSYASIAGETTVIGGIIGFSDDSANVVCMNIDRGRGITHKIVTTDTPYTDRVATLMRRSGVDTRLYEMSATRSSPSDPNRLGWLFNSNYTPAYWWAFNHGTDTNRNMFLVSSTGVGLSPGAGWTAFPHGFFEGQPGVDTFLYRGLWVNRNLNQIRGGRRYEGDSFKDGSEEVLVLESATDANATPASAPAYHGHVDWTTLSVIEGDFVTSGYSGTRVEPTATFGKTNSKVFRLYSGTIKGNAEPNWSTAVNAGDHINDNAGSGNIVWELVGYRPPLSRQAWATTTNTANQVIAEVTIPADSTCTVFAVVSGNVTATGNGFTAQVNGSFKRNGTGNPAQLGTTDLVMKKAAALAINTTTGIDLNIDNTLKRVQVRVSPGETITYSGMVRIEVLKVV